MALKIFYDHVDPNLIFGMVGRCGGGHNSVWLDWSEQGRKNRQNIIQEFESSLNELCGHYTKLEKDILKNGFLDPLIITCGYPRIRSSDNLPPELLYTSLEKSQYTLPEKLLLLEGTTGGSRLWVAQKHNIPVPCIVNDFTGKYDSGRQLHSLEDIKKLFADQSIRLKVSTRYGVVSLFSGSKIGSHLGEEWSEDKLVHHRAPLWVKIMNKYGYYVDNLNDEVSQILLNNGVIQPESLKKLDNN